MSSVAEIHALYKAGVIDWAEYKRRRDAHYEGLRQETREREFAARAVAIASSGASTKLVNSELALLAESRRTLHERDARTRAQNEKYLSEVSKANALQQAIDQERAKPRADRSQERIDKAKAVLTQTRNDMAFNRAQLQHDELTRRTRMREPSGWEDLPAEEQGFFIAQEHARRRAAEAAAAGEQVTDVRPAWQAAPVTVVDGVVTMAPLEGAYDPGSPVYVPMPAGPDLSAGGYGLPTDCAGETCIDEFDFRASGGCVGGTCPADPPPDPLPIVPPPADDDSGSWLSDFLASLEFGGSGGAYPTDSHGVTGASSPPVVPHLEIDWTKVPAFLDTALDFLTEGGEATFSAGPGFSDPRLEVGRRSNAGMWIIIGIVALVLLLLILR